MNEPNDQQEPAPSLETPEKKKLSLRNKLLLGGAGVALAAVAATGIGLAASSQGEKAPEATSSSAPADPSAEPSTTSEATSTPSPEVVVPDISMYEAMSVTEFSALPNDEQMIFAAAKLAPGIQQFASDYHSRTNDPTDILPVGSADNTAQEIATQVTYNLRFAFTLDGDDREKFIIAVLRNDNQSGIYPIIEDLSQKEVTTFTGKEMGYLKTLVAGTATSMSAIGEDTNHTKFTTVTESDGKSFKAYYYEIPMGNNTTYKTWIRE